MRPWINSTLEWKRAQMLHNGEAAQPAVTSAARGVTSWYTVFICTAAACVVICSLFWAFFFFGHIDTIHTTSLASPPPPPPPPAHVQHNTTQTQCTTYRLAYAGTRRCNHQQRCGITSKRTVLYASRQLHNDVDPE